jgi:endonuclease-3
MFRLISSLFKFVPLNRRVSTSLYLLPFNSMSSKIKQESNSSAASAAPAYWQETYKSILSMRTNRDAPVDSQGCSSLAAADINTAEYRFQTLLSLMLSSQTKDATTASAMGRLHDHFRASGGLTVKSIQSTDEATIDELIKQVGFHRNKASFIKRTAEILAAQYQSDIPNSVEGLISLPGVGPKMAYLAMSCAWHDKTVGIGVDVHVHRICNRLG